MAAIKLEDDPLNQNHISILGSSLVPPAEPDTSSVQYFFGGRYKYFTKYLFKKYKYGNFLQGINNRKGAKIKCGQTDTGNYSLGCISDPPTNSGIHLVDIND